MTLKQRRTPLDPVLLHVVLPLLHEAHLTSLTRFTRLWHITSGAPPLPSLAASAAPVARPLPAAAFLQEAA